MASARITLVGKSGKKYTSEIMYTDGGASLGCHSKMIAQIAVTAVGATWEQADDIRANKDNWKTVYDSLARDCGGVSHVVMSDNFANVGPREHYREYIKGLGYLNERAIQYSSKIWRTCEVMQIIEALAPSYGHSMTCSPTSGNPLHTGQTGYSACVSGIWIKPSQPVIVWAPTMKEFWEKVKTTASKAAGYIIQERPTSDPASISFDPEKAKEEAERVAVKVANIWGE